MDFKQPKKNTPKQDQYHFENLHIARNFSKGLILELKELVKSIVIFGSSSKNTQKKESDIDIMVVLDNVGVFVTPELREAYKIISSKLIKESSDKIHLFTVNLSDLWDMARKGDPLLITILRDGIPLFDRDIIDPMQFLLESGKIKPTIEAIHNYNSRAQTLFEEHNKHLHEAILDLYYATIDSTHALLMSNKQIVSSPKDMPELFLKEYKGTPLEEYSLTISSIYSLAKDIEHKRVEHISGTEYNKLEKNVKKLIHTFSKEIKKNIEENKDNL